MMEFGGKTSSVMFTKIINGKSVYLFIDAGLGIIDAGKQIVPSFFDGTGSKEMTILFTHLHPDHTEGFTFFAPNFIPGTKLHLLGPSSLKKNVGMVLQDKMAPPTYPIEYKDLKSERLHGIVSDGQTFYIDNNGKPVQGTAKVPLDRSKLAFEVKVMQSFAPSHPQQGSIYYRITDVEMDKSVACIWDIESRKGGDQRVIAFSKGADVMIHDTQYTEQEYDSDKMIVQGFGHSTYEMAIENAVAAGVGTLYGFHFNPTHTDVMLEMIETSFGESPLEFKLAREGWSFDL
jgi:ribonuclease BN (tRNA processing enzyme)